MSTDRLAMAIERLTEALERAIAMERESRTECQHQYLYDPTNNRYVCRECGKDEPI